jgi:hypothetical protein
MFTLQDLDVSMELNKHVRIQKEIKGRTVLHGLVANRMTVENYYLLKVWGCGWHRFVDYVGPPEISVQNV